jgi:hypothetical protein
MAGDAESVAIAELRAAVARLLDAAEKRFGPHVQMDSDVYWAVSPSDAFDTDSEPNVVAKQLSDDLGTVREVLRRADAEQDELLLWHDLDHVVGLLQWIVYRAAEG